MTRACDDCDDATCTCPADDDVVAMARAAGCTQHQLAILTNLANGIPVTLVAELYGVHKRTVYKIRDRAIMRIRHHQATEGT